MDPYVTHYTARVEKDTYEHKFTEGSGWGRRLTGHFVEGKGIPLSIAQKIVEGWTEDNAGTVFEVKGPTAEEDEPM
jgi:hypothetical protein